MKKFNTLTVILGTIMFLFCTCDKEEKIFPPGIITASVDEITGTSARVGGRISDNGGAEITECGVFWGTSSAPQNSGTKTEADAVDATFYETLSGLSPGVKYYVTAYAINPAGTSYGDETFFTTQINLPVVTTSAVSELTSTTARVGGLVNDDGGFGITQRGIYWGTDPDPRLTGTRLELGSGDGEFSTTLTGLSREFTYYVQAFATNIKGTSYGGEISFVTEPGLATIVTSTPYDITPFSATVGGNISSDGGIGVTERGVFWGRSPDPVTTGIKLQMGTGTGSFETVIDTLSPAVTYYLQAYAVNLVGTSRGEEKQFTTKGSLPVISKTFITDLTQTSAVLNITLGKGDLPSLLSVDYGITVAYGSSTIPLNIPEIKADTTIKITIDGLQSLTYYHYRAMVSNDLGTVYSSDAEFRTVITGKEGTVTDVEGNLYNTIGIGYQEWMTRNLKSVLYNDGTPV
ncbi:MAG: hypothetical protein RBS37_13305, partial [Bacteroidales bacterium]|nr:hypothetical protein [Bacteroidales bacterium]